VRFLVTGGMGFIGSNFVRHLLSTGGKDLKVVNLDKLTYAGNPDNLKDLAKDKRHVFVKGDICDRKVVERVMKGCDVVVHFAAETHVDRSILDAGDFIKTDVYGTFVLLESARRRKVERFVQISTDEVYGQILKGSFKETDPLNPRNPYSASKAAADRLAYSYSVTHKVPVIITRSSNNFGPYQYPEKLIPLFVTNLIEGGKVPLYGSGKNVRDWLYVVDNCEAIDFIIRNGDIGEVYNIGGGKELENIEITRMILELMGKDEDWIEHVDDRPGHDLRYSLSTRKIRKLGWRPRFRFKRALKATVRWYVENGWWWRKLKGRTFKKYYKRQYGRKH
jgi:dTDP-glucose 4,6-dehydratase